MGDDGPLPDDELVSRWMSMSNSMWSGWCPVAKTLRAVRPGRSSYLPEAGRVTTAGRMTACSAVATCRLPHRLIGIP